MSEIDESDVKKRIMRAATRLFANKGYGSTSVREVVEAAGVTKPTLYYWFANKEALFSELIQTHMDNLAGLVEKAVGGPGSVRERLSYFVHVYTKGAMDNKDVVRLMITAHHPADSKQPRMDMMSMHSRRMLLFADLFREGVRNGELRADLDVEYAVRAFVGLLNAHSMACIHGANSEDSGPDCIIELFYRGVSG